MLVPSLHTLMVKLEESTAIMRDILKELKEIKELLKPPQIEEEYLPATIRVPIAMLNDIKYIPFADKRKEE